MASQASPLDLSSLRVGGKRAMARALAAIEIGAGSPELAAFLDACVAHRRAHMIGLTGPPGVGKSTLSNALIRSWRASGATVGVIAVDPSSQRTGGALLGDRARLATDPEDRGIFVRSMAARDRLGGLSDHAISAAVIMGAIYDYVLIESVGIGQSEADISLVADSVILCIQPGSGDSLQFMKAGIMEVPDVVAVTKADMGAPAQRAKAEVEGALTLAAPVSSWKVPVVAVSATTGSGLDGLAAALNAHESWMDSSGQRVRRRVLQQRGWIREAIRVRFGSEGLNAAASLEQNEQKPFQTELSLAKNLMRRYQP